MINSAPRNINLSIVQGSGLGPSLFCASMLFLWCLPLSSTNKCLITYLGATCLIRRVNFECCVFCVTFDLDLVSPRTHDALGHMLTSSLPVLRCCCHVYPAEFHLPHVLCNWTSSRLWWSSWFLANSFHLRWHVIAVNFMYVSGVAR